MTTRGPAALALLVVVVVLAAGCGPGPVDLGSAPEFLWWTDHETGDTSDWLRDKSGSTFTDGEGLLDVVKDHARSGRYSLRSVVTTPLAPDPWSIAAAVREGLMTVDAYYSAWYFIPEPVTATSYWLFFKFRSRDVAGNSGSFVEGWDFDVRIANGGAMEFALYSHFSNSNAHSVVNVPVPIGSWFQVEAFLRPADDESGRLTIWVNGVAVFDILGQATMPSAWVEWNVGGVTEGITPSNATFYVDDAAITTKQLGPNYPVFWRQK